MSYTLTVKSKDSGDFMAMKVFKRSMSVIIVLLIAVLMELGIFNFSYFVKMSDKNLHSNVQYDLSDFEKQNWIIIGDELTSQSDPILVASDVNMKVKEIKIQATADSEIPYVVLFYTDAQHAAFTGDTMLTLTGGLHNTFETTLSKDITKLRIDLGDDAGLVLRGLTVTLNPNKMNFSISRIIAILVICFGAKFLFTLQRSPDYGISTDLSNR